MAIGPYGEFRLLADVDTSSFMGRVVTFIRSWLLTENQQRVSLVAQRVLQNNLESIVDTPKFYSERRRFQQFLTSVCNPLEWSEQQGNMRFEQIKKRIVEQVTGQIKIDILSKVMQKAEGTDELDEIVEQEVQRWLAQGDEPANPLQPSNIDRNLIEQAVAKIAIDFADCETCLDRINADSLFSLGFCYDKGIGVEVDQNMALMYYKAAARQKFAPALNLLGEKYEADVDAFDCFKAAVAAYGAEASEGKAAALYNLGNGYETRNDKEQAIHCYKEAEEMGHPGARFKIGKHHFEEADPDLGITLISNAASLGVADALTYLGTLFERGVEGKIEVDLPYAVKLYKEALLKGDDTHAPYYLGLCYLAGRGCHQNTDQALNYFVASAEAGLAEAQEQAGLLWLDKHDAPKGVSYLLEAEKQGLGSAALHLSKYYYEAKDFKSSAHHAGLACAAGISWQKSFQFVQKRMKDEVGELKNTRLVQAALPYWEKAKPYFTTNLTELYIGAALGALLGGAILFYKSDD